jgi:hypothetical protein
VQLSNEQDTIYNYGKPSMGKSKVDFTYTNLKSVDIDSD